MEEAEGARKSFERARSYFQRALYEEPANEDYKGMLEEADKFLSRHATLRRHLASTFSKHTSSSLAFTSQLLVSFTYLCNAVIEATALLPRQKVESPELGITISLPSILLELKNVS